MTSKNNLSHIHKVEASPAKAFFVDMITRDIELQDAILDLIDNCVDGIKRTSNKKKLRPYEGYFAELTISEDQFSIKDNCGGIPLDIAQKYAFMMGRPASRDITCKGSIGVYGIGMKRAIFKMGRNCVVHSHHKDDSFEVAITEKWMESDTDWNLEAIDTESHLEEYGTEITIRALHRSISDLFAEGSNFRRIFNEVVGSTYAFLINKGFVIRVNGEVIVHDLPKLIWSPNDVGIRPYVFETEIDNVKVFLCVGFRERPKTNNDEDDNTETSLYRSEDAGWSIVCNDRVVLSNDRTRVTGWGFGGVPSYHTQFIAISGFVIFEGNARDLPMNTVKRGVDANSELYSKIRDRMQHGMKYFTSFTNEWKGEDVEKMFTNVSKMTVNDVKIESKKMTKTKTIEGFQMVPSLPKRERILTHRRISFVKSIAEINAVSEYFDDQSLSPSKLGELCFDSVLKEIK